MATVVYTSDCYMDRASMVQDSLDGHPVLVVLWQRDASYKYIPHASPDGSLVSCGINSVYGADTDVFLNFDPLDMADPDSLLFMKPLPYQIMSAAPQEDLQGTKDLCEMSYIMKDTPKEKAWVQTSSWAESEPTLSYTLMLHGYKFDTEKSIWTYNETLEAQIPYFLSFGSTDGWQNSIIKKKPETTRIMGIIWWECRRDFADGYSVVKSRIPGPWTGENFGFPQFVNNGTVSNSGKGGCPPCKSCQRGRKRCFKHSRQRGQNGVQL